MENSEYIENFFKGGDANAQKEQFEKRILEDTAFAEEVAFYISSRGVVQQQLDEQRKQTFRTLYQQSKVIPIRQPVKRLWQYMAAASVVIALMVLSWFWYGSKTSSQQLADKYVQQNLQTLPVTMGNQDSLQRGLKLFNSGKLPEALAIFAALAKDSLNSEAETYAGIASMRLRDYERALQYFTLLENDVSLYSNPGTFYKAVTLLERNKKGDKEAAKLLLEQVVAKDKEGKSQAVLWLQKF